MTTTYRISIHAPLAGCDPPARADSFTTAWISIHAPLAGCDFDRIVFGRCKNISIHAPLAGCDRQAAAIYQFDLYFNPRTPCGVRQYPPTYPGASRSDFNPRTPCGVRPCDHSGYHNQTYFNPRTPCGVRRRVLVRHRLHGQDFNPRTPCGVRPTRRSDRPLRQLISIHAPLAGCDVAMALWLTAKVFQSTHPLRGATQPILVVRRVVSISIHAPLAGCDDISQMIFFTISLFQSTHPLRGATAKTYKENCTFFELADKLSARIAAKKPSAKADRCA